MHNFNDNTVPPEAALGEPTARLLELCADQITAALAEAFGEIDALSLAFLETARHADALLDVVGDRNSDVTGSQQSVLANSDAIRRSVKNAGMRLQFADRLEQRLSNLSMNITGLAQLMRSTDLPITNPRWIEFLTATRATFTMEQERKMFDAKFGTLAAVAGADPTSDAPLNPESCKGDNRRGE